MTLHRVMIVEDDCLIALDVEQALIDAGFEVCGIAGSQSEALAMGRSLRPEMAVVDVALGPGDGRVVAKDLSESYGTAVLFATGQCDEIEHLEGSGAIACLPKPYAARAVPRALEAICEMADGHPPARLPDHMIALAA